MNASKLRNQHRNQKRQGNTDRRNQAKKDINQALDTRADDFAKASRKINEFYTRFAVESDADGFAQAVIDYASKSQCLAEYITELYAIVDGHRYLKDPQEQSAPQNERPETAQEVYDREQKRLESMNREFQKFLRRIS